MEEIKNITKERSLNKTKASLPIICAKLVGPVAVGGVFGKNKANTPSITELIIAISKMTTLSPTAMKPMIFVTTIQDIVPKTLMDGNSFSGFVICCIDMEVVNAMVGVKEKQYRSMIQKNVSGSVVLVSAKSKTAPNRLSTPKTFCAAKYRSASIPIKKGAPIMAMEKAA
jgi:hypothetical protein